MADTRLAYVDDEQCARFGLDAARVQRLARRLERAAQEARAMGLVVFGGSGTGSLRFTSAGSGTDAQVAAIGSNFDGGDGGDK